MRVPYLSLLAIFGLSLLWAPRFIAAQAPAEVRSLVGSPAPRPSAAAALAQDMAELCRPRALRRLRYSAASRKDAPGETQKKDRLEAYLEHQVCSGEMPLRVARLALAQDWRDAYRKYLSEAR
jgi:hypothetical protein